MCLDLPRSVGPRWQTLDERTTSSSPMSSRFVHEYFPSGRITSAVTRKCSFKIWPLLLFFSRLKVCVPFICNFPRPEEVSTQTFSLDCPFKSSCLLICIRRVFSPFCRIDDLLRYAHTLPPEKIFPTACFCARSLYFSYSVEHLLPWFERDPFPDQILQVISFSFQLASPLLTPPASVEACLPPGDHSYQASAL